MFNTNKKIIFVLAFAFVLNAVFFSANVFAQRKRIRYDIIDQRGGKRAKQPKWMFKGTTALEKDYPNKMAFIISGRGKSLNFVESWAKRVNSSSEVARYLSQSITDMTAASEYGGDESFQRTMETLTTSVSKVKIIDLRREDDWWILKEYKDGAKKGQQEYEYYVLYLIDSDIMKRIINNEVEKAISGENEETKSRVKSAMDKLTYEYIENDEE